MGLMDRDYYREHWKKIEESERSRYSGKNKLRLILSVVAAVIVVVFTVFALVAQW